MSKKELHYRDMDDKMRYLELQMKAMLGDKSVLPEMKAIEDRMITVE